MHPFSTEALHACMFICINFHQPGSQIHFYRILQFLLTLLTLTSSSVNSVIKHNTVDRSALKRNDRTSMMYRFAKFRQGNSSCACFIAAVHVPHAKDQRWAKYAMGYWPIEWLNLNSLISILLCVPSCFAVSKPLKTQSSELSSPSMSHFARHTHRGD